MSCVCLFFVTLLSIHNIQLNAPKHRRRRYIEFRTQSFSLSDYIPWFQDSTVNRVLIAPVLSSRLPKRIGRSPVGRQGIVFRRNILQAMVKVCDAKSPSLAFISVPFGLYLDCKRPEDIYNVLEIGYGNSDACSSNLSISMIDAIFNLIYSLLVFLFSNEGLGGSLDRYSYIVRLHRRDKVIPSYQYCHEGLCYCTSWK